MMDVKDASKAAGFSPEKMKKNNLFQTERVSCDVYGLEPGQSQKAHAHDDQDKIYMVLSGQAKVKVGGDEQTLGPNQIVIAPAGEEHGVSNPGPDRLTLLVVIAPRASEHGHHGHGHEHGHHGHGHHGHSH